MGCYCQSRATADPLNFLNIQFTNINATDTTKYCQTWSTQRLRQSVLTYGTSFMVSIINILVCSIFEKVAHLEAAHTQVEETWSQFYRVAIILYINTTVVILLVSFNLTATGTDLT